jgi:hypothetical protein
MSKIRCLTIRPAYAAAILDLGKDVENRFWITHYRGPLAIHAGMRLERQACAELKLNPDEVICGAIIGTVDLVDIVENSRSKWAYPGEYHWILKNPRRLRQPIFQRGKLGLYTVDLGRKG